MTLVERRGESSVRSSLGYAYLMTAVAVGCICVSGVFGSIFSPDFVSTSGTATGYVQQHSPVAAYSGWVWDAIALAMVLPAAMRGIRAKVTDRVPWTVLGLGTGGVWLAVMFVSIFAPVMVSGTAPWLTWTPLGEIFAVIAGIILTYILCKFVKMTFFPAEVQAPAEQTTREVVPEFTAGEPATRLRQLAQLRDSGVITEAEFQAKKDELLTRF
ncbi:MAG TPA: SHOCT domain-containing protein [Acidimicrobiales bacterium]|nr:SHOCT domain-containing protein [Acidimicrobiales bacterium]